MYSAADVAGRARRPRVDVVVLGGGPAGTAAGMTLLKRSGTSVAVVEGSDYATPRIGESLSPGIRPLLEYLDLWEPFRREQSLDTFGSRAAWGGPTLRSLDYMFTVHGSGWALDRARFDRMLARAFARRGGTLYQNRRYRGCARCPGGGWEVRLRGAAGREEQICCRYLIDATGRRGTLARELGVARTIHDRLVGVGAMLRRSASAAIESTIQVEACEYGWWYTAPVPGNRIAVVLMSDADLVRRLHAAAPDRWRSLLNDMPLTRQRLRGTDLDEKPRVFSSHSSCLKYAGGEGWVAVGDAVASHDPLSSTGIPHAIGSGVHGALVAADALFSTGRLQEDYQHSIRGDFQEYLDTHWRYYRREQRWSEATFWQRRRAAVLIDANATIEWVGPLVESEAYPAVHLSHRHARELHESCRPGRAAHQIVRSFVDTHPSISDQRGILGFQELSTSGHVRLSGGCQKLHPDVATAGPNINPDASARMEKSANGVPLRSIDGAVHDKPRTHF